MSYENLLLETSEHVALVTINRPKVLNALNAKTIEELDACFREFQQNPEIRAVILTGAGERAFVAWADLGELATYSPRQARECALRGQAVFHRIENLGKPTIAAIANRVVLSLYGKREIQGLAGLKGRVLAVLTPGGTSDFLARILAQEAGLTPGKDIRILYMKSAPEILAALTQGNADAGIISAPMTLRARQLGFKEIVDVVGKNIPMVHSSLATTRDFVGDHRDRVRRFLQGYIEGIKVARGNPEETKRIVGKYTKITGQENLEETYRTFVGAWEKVPYVSSAAVQTILNFSTSPNAKTAKPEQFIDNSILEELERSGFISQLYQP